MEIAINRISNPPATRNELIVIPKKFKTNSPTNRDKSKIINTAYTTTLETALRSERSNSDVREINIGMAPTGFNMAMRPINIFVYSEYSSIAITHHILPKNDYIDPHKALRLISFGYIRDLVSSIQTVTPGIFYLHLISNSRKEPRNNSPDGRVMGLFQPQTETTKAVT